MASKISEIRELAKRFNPEQIEGCITEQMETGRNVCLTDEESGRVIDELSKAEYIRALVDKGVPLPDALRRLALQMRRLQKQYVIH